MKTFSNRLNITYNSASLSDSLSDFTRDTESITLLSTEYIYLSRAHRFNHFYVALTTASSESNTITLEALNGSTWTALSIIDDTRGFTRNGFIQIDPEEEIYTSTYESFEGYNLRLSVENDTDAMVINAINILLCDDKELVREFPPILTSDFLLGQSDFSMIHQSVRDMIIQKFRNVNALNSDGFPVDAFDLVDLEDVRVGATYHALAKIFFNVSDSSGDVWDTKAKSYIKKGDKAIGSALVRFQDIDKRLTVVECRR